jgi:hypothetical protein
MIRHTPLKRNTKPIRRNSPLKRSIHALKRSRVKRKPRKKQPGDNPEYLAWLRTWPCFVCFKKHCYSHGFNFEEMAERYRGLFVGNIRPNCGPTEAAHVGVKGTGQRCPDREAMPLGRGHHRDPLDGGRPDSHHAGTKTFWKKHGLDRNEVLELLHRLYRDETGIPI